MKKNEPDSNISWDGWLRKPERKKQKLEKHYMRQLLLRYYNIYEFMDENDSNFDMNSEPLSSRSNKYRKKYLRRTEKMGRWKSTE